MSGSIRMYGIGRGGQLLPWLGVFCMASQARREAPKACLRATDYEQLRTTYARWEATKKLGYRVIPVTVQP